LTDGGGILPRRRCITNCKTDARGQKKAATTSAAFSRSSNSARTSLESLRHIWDKGELIMRLFLFCVLTVFLVPAITWGQTCKVDDRFLAVKVEAKEAKSDFTFELVYVFCRNGQPFEVKQLKNKAPFDFRITQGVAYLAVRGVSGDGKIVFKYKTSYEEKQSIQYISANELVAASWMPLAAAGSPGMFWTSHKPQKSPAWNELSVITATKETP
jgi:hypothetical protein